VCTAVTVAVHLFGRGSVSARGSLLPPFPAACMTSRPLWPCVLVVSCELLCVCWSYSALSAHTCGLHVRTLAACTLPPGGAPGAGPASTDLTASSAMPSNAVLALDGAHTEKSMRVCARWFHHWVCRHFESAEGSGGGSGGDAASPDGTHHPDLNVLVFNCGHEKSALELLLPLSTLHLHHVLLAPFDASRPSRMGYPDADAVVDMYFAEHALRAGGASVASDASGDSSKGTCRCAQWGGGGVGGCSVCLCRGGGGSKG
jgi:hypothetical protein